MGKKIIFISGDFAPQLGGIAQFMLDIIKELPSERVYVIALPTPGWREFDENQAFTIKRLPIPERWYPFNSYLKYLSPLYLIGMLKVHDPGMVVCCHAHHALMVSAWSMSKLRNVPYSVFLHGYDIWGAQKRRYQSYYNTLLRSADLVYPNGRATYRTGKTVGVPIDKLAIVNPCINIRELNLRNDSQAIYQKHELKDKQRILTVARLVERKGCDTVIRALPKIIQSIPNIHYLIVGDGPAKEAFINLAVDLNVAEYITFIGPVAHTKVKYYFDLCDVFVMITREDVEKGDIESFGIVYLEANYFGKPVVAGRAGGVEDAVIHGETGLLVNPTDENEVAEAIIQLLQNPELSQKLGEQGRQRVIAEFTSRATAQKFVSALPEHLQAGLF